jgi:hypothetical protein
MRWEKHTESLQKNGHIFIETDKYNENDPWLKLRIKEYRDKGHNVYIKFLNVPIGEPENDDRTSTDKQND